MGPALAAPLVLLFAAGAVALPGPSAHVACSFTGGGRHIPVTKPAQDIPDVDLTCDVEARGLAPGDRELGAELALHVRTGPPRTVASGRLERGDVPGTARGELVIPPSTWAGALRWTSDGRPYLQLVVRVLEARRTTRAGWLVVIEAERRIEGRGRKKAPPKRGRGR